MDATQRPLTDIIPYVQPHCTALPEEMVMDYGRRAYIEFCQRSGALSKSIVMDLQEGVCDYPLVVCEGYKVSRVNYVAIEKWSHAEPTFDHNAYTTTGFGGNFSGGSMSGSYGYGPNSWCACGPYYFSLVGYDYLILRKAPGYDCANGLRVEVSLQPTQDVCTFDADFFDRWVEGITYGVFSKALLLPNTDWYEPKLADYYLKKFKIEIQRARHKFDLNNSRGPMRLQGRRFV